MWTTGKSFPWRKQYLVTFIVDASIITFVHFLKAKKDVLKVFKEFKAYSETQTGIKLKWLGNDSGGECNGKQFEDFPKLGGIRHKTTVPYYPRQKRLAERMNRAIQERARSLMFVGKLDK